jgi:hypothetical protein
MGWDNNDRSIGWDGKKAAQWFVHNVSGLAERRLQCIGCAVIWKALPSFISHEGNAEDAVLDGKTACLILLFPLSNPVIAPIWWDTIKVHWRTYEPKGFPFQLYC